MWFQKSREEWICSGDRNTKFYHASTVLRRHGNKIDKLRDSNGDWMMDPNMLRRHVRDFYVNIFSVDNLYDVSLAPKGYFSMLQEEEMMALHALFTKEEVKQALFDMRPFKAPGPDGF